MTYQDHFTLPTELLEQVAEQGLDFLPESLPVEQRNKTVQLDISSRFKGLWQVLNGPLSMFLLLSFLVSFGLSNLEGVFGLFALERFSFGPSEVGLIMVVVGTVVALSR